MVLPQSTTGTTLSPSLGLGFSLSRKTGQQLAWQLAFIRSAHILEAMGNTFRQGTEQSIPDEAAEGTARQVWSRLGLRWTPRLGGSSQARLTGVLGWGIGAVHSRNTLDLPSPSADTRIHTTTMEPSVQTELGLELTLQEWLVLHMGCQAGLVLGYDPSEIGGGGQVPIYGRISPALEFLVRF